MNYFKTVLLLCCFSLAPQFTFSQSNSEEDNVKATITSMFDAMRNNDSTTLRKIFDPKLKMVSVFYTTDGISKMKEGDMEGFIKAVGKSKEEIWDERIHSFTIKIDGNLATAWTPYSFYLGDKFLHCGTNAFHLFKDDDLMWKIIHISDTRKKKLCKEYEG